MPKVGTAYVSIRARLDQLERDLKDAKGLTTKHANETARAVSNAFKGIIAYFGVRELKQFGESIFDTGREVARLQKSFTEITGSTSAANKEFDFLRKTSDDLGQNFYNLTESYKGILAASKGTALEGEATRDIFIGITKAGATLGLTSDSIAGALNAVQQMMSKGKVQAEELRGQLGERLSVAFNLSAEAMGKTTAELNKMLDNGQILATDLLPKLGTLLKNRYSGSVDDATRASNKLSEAWTDVKTTMAQSGFLDSISNAMIEIAKTMKDESFQRSLKDVAKNIGEIVKGMAELFKYAGLRSISGTAGQAAELAKQGRLDIQEFLRAGFLERQKMVDAILNDQTGKTFKIKQPETPSAAPNIPVADISEKFQTELDNLQKIADEANRNLSDTINYDIDYGLNDILIARQQAEDEFLKHKQQSLKDYWEFEFQGFSSQADRLIAIEDEKARQDQEAKALAVQRVGDALELIGRENETAFKIYKAYKIAEAIITGLHAAVVAWDAGYEAGGPYAGPYLAAAYAAASLAYTGAQIAAMGGSQGGTQSGGSTPVSEVNATTGIPETRDESRGQLVINIYGDVSDPRSFVDNMVERINDAADRDVFINYARETRA